MTATVERMRHCWASTSTVSLEACLVHECDSLHREINGASMARRAGS